MKEDQALIEQLCIRFEKKPRKCKKINDSNIGSAERILCISNNTFYYYPKIQEFQDLDFDKLQYIVPKAGVKLNEILQLKFPARRENQRNYFTIVLPKNKILKFTKTLKEIIVDEEAEGQQIWTFYFDYDIVALPIKQKKLKEAKLKQIQTEKLKRQQAIKLKQKHQQEKLDKINEEIGSLAQAEQLSKVEETQQYAKKRMMLNEKQQKNKFINESDQLFFHFYYRKLLTRTSEKQTVQNQLGLLEQIGKFRGRAEETVKLFIDELPFSNIKFKFDHYYEVNNLKIKFGTKSLNQQFLANNQVANSLYALRFDLQKQMRVPLTALIKYKGFKAFVRTLTPLDELNDKDYDNSIIHGNSSDNWKIDFTLADFLIVIIDQLKLKPYFSEVHYQKVQIHLGSRLKIMQTIQDPFYQIKKLDSTAFQQKSNYKINYLFDIDEVFPIDLDLNKNINQENVRLRPEYIRKFINQAKESITHLSAGSLTYANDDEQGEKEDINVAKASQKLKLQQIVKFVRCLDNLDYIIQDSQSLSQTMKMFGINMRYLGLIIKMTSLPYVRVVVEIQAISRVIRSIYRDHQKQFCLDLFRKGSSGGLIAQYLSSKTNQGMKKIRLKQLKIEEENASISNAIDFLNLIFGMSPDFEAFWQIVRVKVLQLYEFEIKYPVDYPHGYLLKTVIYHCGIKLKMRDDFKLFFAATPFTSENQVHFECRSKVYQYPSMQLYRVAASDGVFQSDKLISRLQLQLMIRRAIKANEASVLLKLSKLTNKVGPPIQKFTLESFYYFLYHPNPDNFEVAYRISQIIFPPSHPCVLELYLQYAKLKDLDPINLKKSAENHAIRNLGLSHWKTSQILFNFKESEYINHLIRAQAGIEQKKRLSLYLQIVNQLAKYGKLDQSLEYVSRAINHFDKSTNLNFKDQEKYLEILLKGIENNYNNRKIEDLLRIAEIMYYSIEKYKIPIELKWHEKMLFYTLKAFLEFHKKKFYLFKLVLVERDKNPTKKLNEKDKLMLMSQLQIKWREARNHINHIKQMLIKLQFGYTEINFLPDFFRQFDFHVKRLKSQDFNEGLKEYNDFYYIFGFDYFENTLLENIYAFEKGHTHTDSPSK